MYNVRMIRDDALGARPEALGVLVDVRCEGVRQDTYALTVTAIQQFSHTVTDHAAHVRMSRILITATEPPNKRRGSAWRNLAAC